MNELLNEQTTFLDVDEKDKDGILKFISHKAKLLDITDDEDALYHDFLEREKEFSTGLQDGFAIPHARTANVKKVTVMFLRNKNGIDWQTLDDKPVKYIFIAIVAGIFISCAIIIVMGLFDTTVKSAEEIEQALKIPVIAQLDLVDETVIRKGGRRKW